MKKIIFTIIGAVLGVPLSYFVQHPLVQMGSIGDYLTGLDFIFQDVELIIRLVLAVVVCAFIGFLIGLFLDRTAKKTA